MKRFTTLLTAMAIATGSLFAADFFSTASTPSLFNFGARLGVNTSNRTVGAQNGSEYNCQGWGTGFDLGFVADINVRDYLAIQPGLFFESRSNTYTFIDAVVRPTDTGTDEYLSNQAGTFNSYAFTIPVMGSLRLNVTDDIRWVIEAGPYMSVTLGSKLKNKVLWETDNTQGIPMPGAQFQQKAATLDFGLKIGTGLQVLKHYYVGVHYLEGFVGAWKDTVTDLATFKYGGNTKAWMFTLGYNF